MCKSEILDGYDHFNHNVSFLVFDVLRWRRDIGADICLSSQSQIASHLCPLWDNVDERHDFEIKRAFSQAVRQFEWDHPGVELPEMNSIARGAQ